MFVDGPTLEAAEAVCEADVDVLEGLVDKSLVQPRRDGTMRRFGMLESIADFAAERLTASGEEADVRARHARYFHDLASRMDALIRAGEPEEGPVSVLEADIDDIRAAVETGLVTGDTTLVRDVTAALRMYWVGRGRYAEGRAWLERALALDDIEDDTRRRLLSALATIAYAQGDHRAAVTASDAAASLALKLGGATEAFASLKEQASAALMNEDYEASEALYRRAFEVAVAADNGVGMSSCRLNLAYIATKTGRFAEAEALLAENLSFVRGRGQARCEATTLASIAETMFYEDRLGECAPTALLGARRALQIGDQPLAVYSVDLLAVGTAAGGDARAAATLLGATEAAREAMGVDPDDDEAAIRARSVELMGDRGVDRVAWEAGRAAGLADALDVASAVELGASNEAWGLARRA